MKTPAFSIYNASAGSGKTYTLVKAYLKVLLRDPSDDAYRKILAITFTNKAVTEMKKRVLDTLYAFSKGMGSENEMDLLEDLAVELALDKEVIVGKSKRIVKSILHNYSGFTIVTIDAFTYRIIRSFALDLGLPVPFNISLEQDLLLEESVDQLIDLAGEDGLLTRILIDFSLDKTDADKSWDVSRDLFQVGKLLLSESDRKEIDTLKDVSPEDFQGVRQELDKQIDALDKAIMDKAKEMLQKLAAKGISLESFRGKFFPNYLEKIALGKPFEWGKYTTKESIRVNQNAKDRVGIEDLKEILLTDLASIYVWQGKKLYYENVIKNITPLSLLQSLYKEMQKKQSEQHSIAISEFNTIIYQHIKNQPTPFIYEQLGERYKHFFIDEFQDTSVLQWTNLIPLIDNALSSENVSGEGGTLLLVGDPKQSIYRWRGGKPEQFIALSEGVNPFSNPDKQSFNLVTNHRSYDEIIRFNNDFFSLMASEFSNENYRNIYKTTVVQQFNEKKGGFISLQFVNHLLDDYSKDEAYLVQTYETVMNCLEEGFLPQDIAILVRNKKGGNQLANYLVSQGVSIISSESLLLKNATEVRLLLALLGYIKNQNDRLSKAYALYYIHKQKNISSPTHSFITEGLATETLTDFEKWLQSQGIWFQFSEIRKQSLYGTVQQLVNTFIAPQNRNAYVQYFLDVVLTREVNQQDSLSSFLEYWYKTDEKHSIPSPENSDAVQILTIHKSKGLQFPVVIFPIAEENYSSYRKEKAWLPFSENDLPKVLVDASSQMQTFNHQAYEHYQELSEEKVFDNLNILYVAFTRAIEQLHIISQWYRNKKGDLQNNMSSYLVKYLTYKGIFSESKHQYTLGKANKLSVSPRVNSSFAIQAVTDKFNTHNIKIADREAQLWGTAQQKAITYGNLIHEILSNIYDRTDVSMALNRAVNKGLIPASETAVIQHLLQQIVEHPYLEVFFDGTGTVLTERTLILPNAPNQKPDRIVIQQSKAYLLDYKTGEPNIYHKAQLNNYAQLLTEIGYTVVDKKIVYIGQTVSVINLADEKPFQLQLF